jgi:hypothetical protein
MNIFYLHEDPVKAAQYQYNKHVVKMILESAQMLCTAHHLIMGDDADVPYKKAHPNHPSTKWVTYSASNYAWLYQHMLALGDEYTKRYGKTHLTITKCKDKLYKLPGGILNIGFSQPPQCIPDEYKSTNAIHGYWRYYILDKHKICNKNETPYTFDTIPEGVSDRNSIPCGN